MAKRPDIDFKTYCKVKHDGDEYSALKALAKAVVKDDLNISGLSQEGTNAVYHSLTQSQLRT